MSFVDPTNLEFLIGIAVILIFFALVYYSASRKQASAMAKVATSLKYQEQTNHYLSQVLTELRRSNRLLSELAGVEPLPEPKQETHAHRQAHPTPQSMEESEESPDSQFKVYVGNVDYAATASELAQHFARCGRVEYVNIPVNRYTGRARGFGFVTFATREEAERAMSLNGSEFKGREIQVNFAKERDQVL